MDKIVRDLKASLKCLFGKHHVPEKLAFSEESMFIAGGICPRCGVLKAGKPIGDIRDYYSPDARREGVFLVIPNGYYVFTSLATMRNLYEFYPEEYRLYLAEINKTA